jgi:hypothetical protein
MVSMADCLTLHSHKLVLCLGLPADGRRSAALRGSHPADRALRLKASAPILQALKRTLVQSPIWSFVLRKVCRLWFSPAQQIPSSSTSFFGACFQGELSFEGDLADKNESGFNSRGRQGSAADRLQDLQLLAAVSQK